MEVEDFDGPLRQPAVGAASVRSPSSIRSPVDVFKTPIPSIVDDDDDEFDFVMPRMSFERDEEDDVEIVTDSMRQAAMRRHSRRESVRTPA